MDFVPVLIVVGIVAFLAYKNKDKILALLNKPDSGAPAPNVGAPAQEPPTVEQPKPTEVPNIIPFDGKPRNQAEWDAYRNSFVPSTRAFIPEKYDPAVVDSGSVDYSPKPLLGQWDGNPWRSVVAFKAGVGQDFYFSFQKEARMSIDPAAGDRRNARYTVSLTREGEPPVVIGHGSFGTFRLSGVVGGSYIVSIVSDKNSSAWVTLG